MDTLIETKNLYCVAVFIYLLMIWQNVREVKKNTNTTTIPWSVYIAVAFVILAIPILAIFLCGFALYRLFINIILKIKYGPVFGGFLSGTDAYHMGGNFSNGIIQVCLMIVCKRYTSKEFYEITRNTAKNILRLSRFNCSFRKEFGYSFMLKQKLDIDDCVSKMKILDLDSRKMNKKEYFQLLSYHYNKPLPENGQVPWQVLIGTQPVDWKEDECDYYPVILKVHHAVGDGTALIKLLITTLTTEQEQKEQQTSVTYNLLDTLEWALELIKTVSYCFWLLSSSLVVVGLYKGVDENIFCNKSSTNETILGIGIERNGEYVKRIKSIKKKFSELSFSTILLTACSASIESYYIKKCWNPPESITIAVPMVDGSSDMQNLTLGKLDIKDFKPSNTYSFVFMKLPINIRNNNSEYSTEWPLINRMKLINKEANILKNSIDSQINRLFVETIFGIVPIPLLEKALNVLQVTTVMSNLAGPPKISYDNGLWVLSDVIPFSPNQYTIGLVIAIITYDGRLQIGLSVNKDTIPSQEDAQDIVDDIYKYLDALETEVGNFYRI